MFSDEIADHNEAIGDKASNRTVCLRAIVVFDIVTVFIDCPNAFPIDAYVKTFKSFLDSLYIDSFFSLALPSDVASRGLGWKNMLFY